MTSKRIGLALTLLLAGCGGGEAETEAGPKAEDIEAARAAAGQLGKELKGKLMAAMSEGGPAAAIAVCSEEAPAIAGRISDETGYRVGRTALRIRNPENAPTDWQTAQLEAFAAEIAQGGEAATMEAAMLATDNGQTEFRWAKPIVLEGPCAMCHGENVSTEIKTLIAEHYPDDEATGFKVGELRGMFTVTRTLN